MDRDTFIRQNVARHSSWRVMALVYGMIVATMALSAMAMT